MIKRKARGLLVYLISVTLILYLYNPEVIVKAGENEIFNDVTDSEKYYYDSVYWAYYMGITTGTSSNTFSPNDPCTREQIVTFLWRFAGRPEPKNISIFTDVKKGSYYSKAVSWAYEKGITVGLNDGTNRFGVGMPCTREMCVSFLWRYLDEPKAITSEDTVFSDVLPDKYYCKAVTWAAVNGITTGLKDGTKRFGIGQTCSRAMIVTFLYRFFNSGLMHGHNYVYHSEKKILCGFEETRSFHNEDDYSTYCSCPPYIRIDYPGIDPDSYFTTFTEMEKYEGDFFNWINSFESYYHQEYPIYKTGTAVMLDSYGYEESEIHTWYECSICGSIKDEEFKNERSEDDPYKNRLKDYTLPVVWDFYEDDTELRKLNEIYGDEEELELKLHSYNKTASFKECCQEIMNLSEFEINSKILIFGNEYMHYAFDYDKTTGRYTKNTYNPQTINYKRLDGLNDIGSAWAKDIFASCKWFSSLSDIESYLYDPDLTYGLFRGTYNGKRLCIMIDNNLDKIYILTPRNDSAWGHLDYETDLAQTVRVQLESILDYVPYVEE